VPGQGFPEPPLTGGVGTAGSFSLPAGSGRARIGNRRRPGPASPREAGPSRACSCSSQRGGEAGSLEGRAKSQNVSCRPRPAPGGRCPGQHTGSDRPLRKVTARSFWFEFPPLTAQQPARQWLRTGASSVGTEQGDRALRGTFAPSREGRTDTNSVFFRLPRTFLARTRERSTPMSASLFRRPAPPCVNGECQGLQVL